jgi:SNF2 family DNA or RNA helicase
MLGMGKTVTMLALMHTNPLRSFGDLKMTDKDLEIRVPSRATLVVCPANLVKQWQQETLKCLGRGAICIVISKIIELRKYSWRDFMHADVIIVSVQFLTNKSYRDVLTEHYAMPVGKTGVKNWNEYFARVMEGKIANGYDSFIDTVGIVNIDTVIQAVCGSLKGNYCWGLTGTVFTSYVAQVLERY